ncbi:MAG: B12-binding domain-containing radical SAM protein [Hyphomicrobiales bacterium]|nr:B12-binding domain-containing radical SAM protein [Hyphomicrobiales bacterium]
MASVYLINPSADFPTYFGAEALAGSGLSPGAMTADLAVATIAAMAPDDFRITICDENIAPVDYDNESDWIAITGKVSQRQRMVAIADEFRRRGKKVVIGGPYASLSPARLRDHCDVLVCGEAEEIVDELFADLRAGKPKPLYVGNKPSLALTPAPRWDLYPNEGALLGTVQTSRGCPFECEFCDVIQYLGRKQRHKPIANVIAELDLLWDAGYRSAFIADDNFTAYRAHCRELLAAMKEWRRDKPMDFVTQISIDAARDPELLDMCVEAGVTQVFVGIESPNLESLREAGKRQNLKVKLVDEIQKLVDHGMAVMGGMIVGFDHDGPDIFQAQYEFAQATPIAVFTLGALMASEATPLHDRMMREGRLIDGGIETQGVPWASNIRSLTMSAEELGAGLKNLSNAIYSPEAFGERMLRFIKTFGSKRRGPPPSMPDPATLRAIDRRATEVSMNIRKLGEAEGRMWNRIWGAAVRRPETLGMVTRLLFQYAQIRHMYAKGAYWEPMLASPPVAPPARSQARRREPEPAY